MRFIPVNCLRPGQIIASDLRMDKQRYLLKRGVALNSKLIFRMKELGFQGAYIDDELSQDLKVDNLISDELRYTAKRGVKSLFTSVEKGNKHKVDVEIGSMGAVVNDIVDEILSNKNIMANMIDLRTFDDYTFSHCVNVAVLATLIGSSLKLSRGQLVDLALGALIHDIGKVFIELELLNKKGKLTDEEFAELRRHVQYGYDYVASSQKIPEAAKSALLTHHEQYNGNGYPNNLAEDDICLYGRIICVADVYDALVANRPYRSGFLPSDAVEYIMAGYGTMFDPEVVDNFTKRVAPYPVGTCVELSTGETAIVVKNYAKTGMRPLVRLLQDEKPSKTEIDLSYDRNALNITIQRIVNL